MARVVHCKKSQYIGRPSKWGNPFTIGRDGTRAEVIEKYARYLAATQRLLDALPELRGKTLAGVHQNHVTGIF